ncbi:MAG: hypothetical protein ABFS86_02155 [Planctomycetota bacterium]
MKTLTIVLIALVALPAWAQDTQPPSGPPIDAPARTEPVEEPVDEGVLLKTVELRRKVRAMRRSVLGGGPAVEDAEREALVFYRKKIQEIASRIDGLRTDRDAKDAEYRLALDLTLEAEDADEGEAAARRAASLKGDIAGLDATIAELVSQRDQLSGAAGAIQKRIDRRQRVLAHFETQAEVLQPLPFLGEDVIGPDDEGLSEVDPFEDAELFADLMRRDPDRARQILFEHDPARYWRMFPLTPPEHVLRRAFPYPRARKR